MIVTLFIKADLLLLIFLATVSLTIARTDLGFWGSTLPDWLNASTKRAQVILFWALIICTIITVILF